MIYKCKLSGLKIGIKPMKLGRDANGHPFRSEGKYVKFVNGEFETEDKDVIDFIHEYMKKWPGEGIVEIDPKQIEKQRAIEARVRAEVEKEMTVETIENNAKEKVEATIEKDLEAEKKAAEDTAAAKEAAEKKAEGLRKKQDAEKKEAAEKYAKINAADAKKKPEKISEKPAKNVTGAPVK